MTPKEYSSGASRYLGHISKRGDRYLRMLLTHAARSVLRAAAVAQGKGREVNGVRSWALQVQALEPQQSGLRAGQQTGAHLLRDAARQREVR